MPKDQWQSLELGSPDDFHYLRSGCTQYFCSQPNDAKLEARRKSEFQRTNGAIQDQLIDDLKCYEQTDRALTNFGLNEQQKADIYTIVAAVLHLGNISFADDPDDRGGGCRLEPEGGHAERALATTARLMGLDGDLLRQSLVSRIMSTTRAGHKGTVYMVQLSTHQAQAARDALAKAIYSKLFDYIVTKIVNKSIPFTSSSYYIGVLDVAGFEYFQHNSFEQFLINFCNEKLQQFFNERILKEEQSIYEKEGLNLDRVEFIDNQDCIQLLEAKATGIFDLLDEESRLPKPNAQHFTQAAHAANKGHFRLAVPRTSKLKVHREIRDDEGFLIRHFAGAVCYETHSFIDKNNDALHASLKNLMLEADHELLRELFTDQHQSTSHPQQQQQQQQGSHQPTRVQVTQGNQLTSQQQQQNKLNFISVGTTFRSQLNDLMGKLRSTGSHFIRCIKPNGEMVAHKFEGGQILSQLHCSGMDSVLRLMQQGYPSRSSFTDLYLSYKRFLPAQLARLDSHTFCRALFKALGLSEQDFRFGSSKVFFRPGKFAEFDQIVRSDSEHVAQLVSRVAQWLIRWRWRKAQYCCLSAIKLQNKIIYRRNLIIKLQRNWRLANVQRKLRFRLKALSSARSINASLREFEQIAAAGTLPPPEALEQGELLRRELEEFVAQLTGEIQRIVGASDQDDDLGKAKLECQEKLDKLATKRDLLIRSIRDKMAKQRELEELERRVAQERKRREEEELAKRREAEIKQQRGELESRRQAELKHEASRAVSSGSGATSGAASQNSVLQQQQHFDEEQEQRDYEIALRLAQEGSLPTSQQLNGGSMGRAASAKLHTPAAGGNQPLAPSQNHAHSRAPGQNFDLTKWKYSDLRDTINTSCDLELLEACKREFHRRLKVYHAWRAMNSSRVQRASTTLAGGDEQQLRAPSSIMEGASKSLSPDRQSPPNAGARGANEQRYFRIPFVKAASATGGQRGWWFAHFDGQWIARQLELHPDKEPILLVAGQHDIEMCELSLRETRLTSKRGAEILPQEFEEEWAKYGGSPYVARGA